MGRISIYLAIFFWNNIQLLRVSLRTVSFIFGQSRTQMTALSFYATIVFELELFRLLYVFNAEMAETTVKIIELEHEKVWFILINIVIRRQIDWNIDMALNDAN